MGGDSSAPLHAAVDSCKDLEGGVDIGIKDVEEGVRCGLLLLLCEVADEMRRCSGARDRLPACCCRPQVLPAAARLVAAEGGGGVVKHGSPVAGVHQVMNSFRDFHFVTIFKSIEVWG